MWNADNQVQACFADVYAAPRDFARRQVLADLLLEQGAVRGEFIALQLDGSSRAQKRADKLLARHRKEFLGPLQRVVVAGTDVWAQGFLVQAQVQLNGRMADEPAWATLERLVVRVAADEPRELASPHFRSLKRVTFWDFDEAGRWGSPEQFVQVAMRHLEAAGREGLVPRGRIWSLR